MVVVLVLLCAIASTGCDLLFNLDRVDRATADASQAIGDGKPDTSAGGALLVFATGVTHSGKFGGLAGADAFCQSRANLASLPGTYKAWLSTSTASPATRMTHSDGPYKLVTGARVADNWADLTDGTIDGPININESGQGAPGEYICQNGQVWSNTDAEGNRSGNNSCGEWASDTASGGAALLTNTDAGWTQPDCYAISCANAMPIYCFQQ